jgi:hypothetical protein
MDRVRRVEELYRKPILFRATPWLLNPSAAKILYAMKLKDFWWGLGTAGTWNLGLAIVGFSLPPQDEYARQAIYRLVKNYQGGEPELFGLKRSPLVLVDRKSAAEEAEYKRRYAFVDWNRTDLYRDGFDEGALGLLFRD